MIARPNVTSSYCALLRTHREALVARLSDVRAGAIVLSDGVAAIEAGQRRFNIEPGDPQYSAVQDGNAAEISAEIEKIDRRLAALS